MCGLAVEVVDKNEDGGGLDFQGGVGDILG